MAEDFDALIKPAYFDARLDGFEDGDDLGTATSRASNGEPYFTLTHAGRKVEGEPVGFAIIGRKSDASLAFKVAKQLFDAKLAEERLAHPGLSIEWRRKPTVRFTQASVYEPQDSIHIVVSARLAFI